LLNSEELAMRLATLILPLCLVIQPTSGMAQAPTGANCPPGVNDQPATPGGHADKGQEPNLSDRLAENKGVLCPPAGVDPAIRQPPPAGGRTPVIPPPGSPGGDQSVQPK
jgi:hypothetical protein